MAPVRADAGGHAAAAGRVGASGVRLKLADGRELVDGMASWWCAIHGYRHPVLDEAVNDQLGRMAHVMFGGLTHEPAIRLAERLTDWTGLDHVFFADSGSVSVEVAIKLVMQAWHGERTKLLTWRGGYHGDTFGAMAVCDPDGGMHSMWRGLLPEHVFAPLPRWDAEWERQVRDALRAAHTRGRDRGADRAGRGRDALPPARVRAAAPRAVRRARDLPDPGRDRDRVRAHRNAVRGGELADVLCLGKALTGRLHDAGGDVVHGGGRGAPERAPDARADLHGQPAGDRRRAGVNRHPRERFVARGCCADRGGSARRAQGAPGEVRVKGAIGVIELDHDVDVPRATQAAVEAGVWLRPFRNLIYAMPPYVTDDEDVARIAAAMVSACASS